MIALPDAGIDDALIEQSLNEGIVTYFVRATNGGPIKIGKSRNLPSRVRDLRNSSPIEVICLGWIAGNFEAELHRRFAADRLHGEWFTATDALLALIDRNVQATRRRLSTISK